jgi:RND family efflux transporter MFP subunit
MIHSTHIPRIAALLLFVGVAHGQTRFSGLVEPYRDVLLSSEVPGRISEILFREGERVEKGEIILRLEDQVELLEVQRREAIYNNRAELMAARERLTLLQEELEATRSLAERTGSVSREELNRKQLETVLAQLDIDRLEQTQALQRIELNMAKERLAQRRIAAPFSGVVAQLPLDEGESVQPNQPALRLVEDTRAFLVVNIPADRARALVPGQPVRLRFLMDREVDLSGEVAFMSPVVDPASGLRRVKMLFSNGNPKIEPGISGFWLAGGEHE